eukprot:3397515-Alexandrium_andersonii.AAC.1
MNRASSPWTSILARASDRQARRRGAAGLWVGQVLPPRAAGPRAAADLRPLRRAPEAPGRLVPPPVARLLG